MLEVYLLHCQDGKEESKHLLHHALAQRGILCCPPIAKETRGKPYFPDCPQLHFNLSHSGYWCLCAIGDTPVGVDVEQVRSRNQVLFRRTLSQEEGTWLEERGNQWIDFYRLWTLKESQVKQNGHGLSIHPKEISVPLLDQGGLGRKGHLYYQSYGGTGWQGAVCSLEPVTLFQKVTTLQLHQGDAE